ncbi:hypothetical protein KFE25_012422 [Diacronema lutheri]|uniref:Tyrosine-protein kinase ephrin type A/B receptor-like domain-containing protein n=3 Tax=Diacronema lutheri TaxID=2081491 RepID=A0A8J5XL46_DIALT|nr:hypothetical protein KFE25_012422 [Diacronema lutheri]
MPHARALLALVALAPGARAHLSALCSATSPDQPGVVTWFLATYHDHPRFTPGKMHVVPPDGSSHTFNFNNWCDAGSMDLVADYDAYVRSLLYAAPFGSSSLACSTKDVPGNAALGKIVGPQHHVTCYTEWDDGTAPESGGYGTWVRPQSTSAGVPQNCAFNKWISASSYWWMRGQNVDAVTWYYNTFVGWTTGTYQIWTSDYDDKLRSSAEYCSGCTSSQPMTNEPNKYPCKMGFERALGDDLPKAILVGTSVADGGAECGPLPALPNVVASSVQTCGAGAFSGFYCPAACQPGYNPSGKLVCSNGQWAGGFACSSAVSCIRPDRSAGSCPSFSYSASRATVVDSDESSSSQKTRYFTVSPWVAGLRIVIDYKVGREVNLRGFANVDIITDVRGRLTVRVQTTPGAGNTFELTTRGTLPRPTITCEQQDLVPYIVGVSGAQCDMYTAAGTTCRAQCDSENGEWGAGAVRCQTDGRWAVVPADPATCYAGGDTVPPPPRLVRIMPNEQGSGMRLILLSPLDDGVTRSSIVEYRFEVSPSGSLVCPTYVGTTPPDAGIVCSGADASRTPPPLLVATVRFHRPAYHYGENQRVIWQYDARQVDSSNWIGIFEPGADPSRASSATPIHVNAPTASGAMDLGALVQAPGHYPTALFAEPDRTLIALTLTTLADGAADADECVPPTRAYTKVGSGRNATVVCSAGHTRGARSGACEPCVAGEYKEAASDGSCSRCDAIDELLVGTQPGATSADSCMCQHESFVALGAGESKRCACATGSGLSGDGRGRECVQCVKGTFSAALDLSACEDCAQIHPALTTFAAGAVSVDDCVCKPIFLTNGTGYDKECNCPSGYVYLPELAACRPTRPGEYKSNQGNEPPLLCSDIDDHLTTKAFGAEGADACECAHESFVLVGAGGTAQCLCPAGTGYDSVAQACCPCPLGTFKPLLALEACTACAATDEHLTTFVHGATALEQCVCEHPSLVRVDDGAGGVSCQCGAGMQLDAANGVCEPCPPGTFKATTGNERCVSCTKLQEAIPEPPAAGGGANATAPTGGATAPHLALQSSTTQCSCENFGYSIVADGAGGRRCLCPEGAGYDDDDRTCSPCAAGSYKTSTANRACTPCAPGSFRSYEGASSCERCEAGFFGPDEGQASCRRRCPEHTFSFAGAAECTPCGRPTVPMGGGNCSSGNFNGPSAGWWSWPIDDAWMRSKDEGALADVSFYRCREPWFCTGGLDGAPCSGGREGVLCGSCPAKTTRSHGGSCARCIELGFHYRTSLLVLTCALLTLLLLAWVRLCGWYCNRQADILALRRVARASVLAAAAEAAGDATGRTARASFFSRASARLSSALSPRSLPSSRSDRSGASARAGAAGGGAPSRRSRLSAVSLSTQSAVGPTPRGGFTPRAGLAAVAGGVHNDRSPSALLLRLLRFTADERFKICLSYMQLVATLDYAYVVPWPTPFRWFVNLCRVLLLDVRFWGLSCLTAETIYTRFAVKAAICLAFFAATLRGLRGCGGCADASVSWDRALFKARLFAAFLTFPVMAYSVVELYPCVVLADSSWLAADLAVRCGTAEWRAFGALGALFGCGYVVGLPLACAYALLRAQRWPELPWQSDEEFVRNIIAAGVRTGRVHEPSFMPAAIRLTQTRAKPLLDHVGAALLKAAGARGEAAVAAASIGSGEPSRSAKLRERRQLRLLGFLYGAFSATLWWWEFVDMARKLVLIALIATVAPGTVTQVVAALLVCVAYALLLATRQPYRDVVDYRVAQCANVCLCVLLALAIVSVGDLGRLSRRLRGHYDSERLFGALLIVLALLPLLVALVPAKAARAVQRRAQKAIVGLLVRHQARARGGSEDAGADASEDIRRQWVHDVVSTGQTARARGRQGAESAPPSSWRSRPSSSRRAQPTGPPDPPPARAVGQRAPRLTDAELDAAQAEIDDALGRDADVIFAPSGAPSRVPSRRASAKPGGMPAARRSPRESGLRLGGVAIALPGTPGREGNAERELRI